ncbi:hypothetical protein L596_005551 [Steinernema carpocapsae]|uniref:Uncharacterized protein n=1 Tax=Steinernema carpocapsae TaxID=34508 RepID=A0A4U8V0Y0_STECR|nr:hypothetical protein L596_005551 [Steinernema carpocapsae]
MLVDMSTVVVSTTVFLSWSLERKVRRATRRLYHSLPLLHVHACVFLEAEPGRLRGFVPRIPRSRRGHVYGDDIVIKSNEIVKTPIVSKEKSEEVEDKVQDDVDKLTTTTEEPENETTTTFDDSHDVNDDKSDDVDDEPVDKDEDEVTDAPEEDEPKESEEDEVTTETPEDDDDKDDQDGKDDNVVKSEQEDDAINEPANDGNGTDNKTEDGSDEDDVEIDENVVEMLNTTENDNATTSLTNVFDHYLYSPEKALARHVFFITIGATIFIIVLGFFFRKRYCCRKEKEGGNVTTKTSNGYKYHVAKDARYGR